MDITTSFALEPTGLMLGGIFFGVFAPAIMLAFLLGGTGGFEKVRRKNLRTGLISMTIIAACLLCGGPLTWAFNQSNLAYAEAQDQIEMQAAEVYGIDLPEGAASRLTERTLNSYAMANMDDSTLITRYGIAEWNEDGDVLAVQLAWNGDEWVLVESGDGTLVELERAE